MSLKFGIVLFLFILAVISSFLQRAKRGRKEWEYEAKLISEENNEIFLELEISKWSKEEPLGEIEIEKFGFELFGDIEVLVNDQKVCHFQTDEKGKNIHLKYPESRSISAKNSRHEQKVTRVGRGYKFPVHSGTKVQNNDQAIVRVNSSIIYGGRFLRD